MHDPAVLAHVSGAEDAQRLLVGVATVDEHRLANPVGELQLAPERALLGFAWSEIAKEIEPGLADRDDAGAAGQPLDLGERRLVCVGGLVRMDADRRPHVRLAQGQGRRGPGSRHVRPDREDAPDARGPRAPEDGVEIAGELGEVQMRMRVEEIRRGHMAPRTVAAFFT